MGKHREFSILLRTNIDTIFSIIVIVCPTLRFNKTYLERSWIWDDNFVYCIEPKNQLLRWIEKLTERLANEETLFIIDDIIADETLDKRRQPLLNLAISGRHRMHSLWILTQSYTGIPKSLRRQKSNCFSGTLRKKATSGLLTKRPIFYLLKNSQILRISWRAANTRVFLFASNTLGTLQFWNEHYRRNNKQWPTRRSLRILWSI